MKKTIFLILALLLAGGLTRLFPCDVSVETAPAAAGGKNRLQVKLFVEQVHRRCPLEIGQTKLETTGLTIEKRGQWQAVGEGLYRLDLTVFLTGKGSGEIRLLRDCPKRGQQKEVLGIARL